MKFKCPKRRVETAKDVLEHMKTDRHSYQEFMDDMVVKALQDNPENLQSWRDWFNKEGEFPVQ